MGNARKQAFTNADTSDVSAWMRSRFDVSRTAIVAKSTVRWMSKYSTDNPRAHLGHEETPLRCDVCKAFCQQGVDGKQDMPRRLLTWNEDRS